MFTIYIFQSILIASSLIINNIIACVSHVINVSTGISTNIIGMIARSIFYFYFLTFNRASIAINTLRRAKFTDTNRMMCYILYYFNNYNNVVLIIDFLIHRTYIVIWCTLYIVNIYRYEQLF